MTLQTLRKKIIPVLRSHNIEYAAIFGSTAGGRAKKGSDIDLLVRFKNDISLVEHIGIAQKLEDIVKRKVDLVTERSLSKHLASNIKKDLQVLYGQIQRPDLL